MNIKYKVDQQSIDGSNDGTVHHCLSELAQFVSDDRNCVRKAIERNLREKVVFSLELHAAHENEPEEVGVFIVSAGDDLVVDERVLNFLIIPVFPFVVSDKDEGGVESTQEVAQQEVEKVLVVVEDDSVVYCNSDEFHLLLMKLVT